MFIKIYQQIKRLFTAKKKEPYLSLYKILGFYPKNIQLYIQALIHRSSSFTTEEGKWINNERLEFLGDAVLNAIVADILFQRFPSQKEGFMTNTRSKIVQRDSLNRIAREMGLDKLIVLSTKISSHNSYIYGNAIEALIGAVYLDQGYRKCLTFVREKIIDQYVPLNQIVRKEVNFKSILIEWAQKNKLPVAFELMETPANQGSSPVFQTSVSLKGTPLGAGTGYTKKESQQLAAKMALKRLRKDKEIRRLVSQLREDSDKQE